MKELMQQVEAIRSHPRTSYEKMRAYVGGLQDDELVWLADQDTPLASLLAQSECRRRRLVQDNEFIRGYVEAGLWASTDDNGKPLDRAHTTAGLTWAARHVITLQCSRFMQQAHMMIEGEEEKAGRDFFLTRNRHGAGFWDGDWPRWGERLTKLAHSFGEQSLYVGDDGKLHVT